MPDKNRIVKPSKKARTVIAEDGTTLTVPSNWDLLAPGDAPLTKLVKSKGPSWLVQVKKGRRLISKGIWSDTKHIQDAQRELEAKRATPEYSKKRKSDLLRKEKKHLEYVENFYLGVVQFLDFDPKYEKEAQLLAKAVTELATPVGSGTVARTQRIPLTDRARSAVIAWLRHQTTGYDSMKIARVKGKRREVRRNLASQSLNLLDGYRNGSRIVEPCPLQKALENILKN